MTRIIYVNSESGMPSLTSTNTLPRLLTPREEELYLEAVDQLADPSNEQHLAGAAQYALLQAQWEGSPGQGTRSKTRPKARSLKQV